MRLSDLHRIWRINMLAKVINQGNDDPNTAATLEPETLQPHDYGRRRVGRPRANWLKETLNDMWDDIGEHNPEARGTMLDSDLGRHRELLKHRATALVRKREHLDS